MVLRDVRDTKTQKSTIQRLKTRADAKWAKRKSKKHRKKNRLTITKNTNKSIVFLEKKDVIQKEEIEEKEVCSICCEERKKLKYINCKRGGLQNINFGRYGDCCKDKSICKNCTVKCDYYCPFCKVHSLRSLKNRFKQKKACFAVKEERRRLKNLIKT
tara:strand:- start:359 stop:832 length:474 start_codon:yes stop_codon:yes gene_type:complete